MYLYQVPYQVPTVIIPGTGTEPGTGVPLCRTRYQVPYLYQVPVCASACGLRTNNSVQDDVAPVILPSMRFFLHGRFGGLHIYIKSCVTIPSEQ
jgi:hypothetical protein